MKLQQIMEEVEKSIEDKQERSKVLEGLLGYILISTKVIFREHLTKLFLNFHAFWNNRLRI